MDEKMNVIPEEMLKEVAGGAVSSKKHIKIVNCSSSCNVRSTPSSKTDANIIGQANLGDCYIFLGWSGSWAKIKYGSATAYVSKDFAQLV